MHRGVRVAALRITKIRFDNFFRKANSQLACVTCWPPSRSVSTTPQVPGHIALACWSLASSPGLSARLRGGSIGKGSELTRVRKKKKTLFGCCVTIVWNETCVPADKAYRHIMMSQQEADHGRSLRQEWENAILARLVGINPLKKHVSQRSHASKYT